MPIRLTQIVKLPDWFVVPTPIGDYNSNWAVVFQVEDEFDEKQDKLYLLRETKSSDDWEARRGTENMKVDCARHYFGSIGVDYDVATGAEEFRQKVLVECRR